ncbi:uncharacterized protein LOC122077950 [Macadamia integrifolia]|uniref:uncharacterized protein LOC122077950 n=1 Tax=Macadamia integrifolia TaxID=60698 RepID=UPI001C4FB40C|nr:uncharacterized protein LOC122077950 [Macadamia integrifolia]
MAFSVKNKLGFVDDNTLTKPDTTDPTYVVWNHVNNMVLSWLLLKSMHYDLAASILYAELATAVWKDLHDHLSPSNGLRIFLLERTVATLQQHNDSIATYYNALKSYWDELATCNPILSCTCGKYRTFSTHY